MVSSPSIGDREGWKTIDDAKPEEVCRHVQKNSSDPENVAWNSMLPQVIHYCQRYFLGPYFFSKVGKLTVSGCLNHPLLG